MQLPSRDGISCDICGLGCKHEFTYYSYDFKFVEVYENRSPPLDSIVSSPLIFSIDVCPLCADKHRKSIVSNYSKVLSPKRRTMIGVLCDLSGALMVGTYNYYYVLVTKIDVRITEKQPPKMTINKRYFEFNVTEEIYKQLTSGAGVVRKVAGEWSTTSNG